MKDDVMKKIKIKAGILAVFVMLLLIGTAYGELTLEDDRITYDEDPSYNNWETRISNSNGKSWAPSNANLQLAIDDLGIEGGTVYLPEGEIADVSITVHSADVARFSIIGKGRYSTILDGNNVDPVLFLDATGGGFPHFEMRNLQLRNSGGETFIGESIGMSKIDNCYLFSTVNTTDNVIIRNASHWATFTSCYIRGGDNALTIDNDSNHVKLISSKVSYGKTGINLTGESDCFVAYGSDISGNEEITTGNGVYIGNSSYNTFDGCYFEHNGKTNINIKGLSTDHSEGNRIINTKIGGAVTNGIMLDYADNTLVEGCLFGSQSITNHIALLEHTTGFHVRNCEPPLEEITVSNPYGIGYSFDEIFALIKNSNNKSFPVTETGLIDAIDDLGSEGGTIWLPECHIADVDLTIQSSDIKDITFIGMGREKTILEGDGSSTTILFDDNAGHFDHVEFRNLQIRSTDKIALDVRNVPGLLIDNCHIYNTGSTITTLKVFDGSNRSTVTNSIIEGGQYGYYVRDCPGSSISFSKVIHAQYGVYVTGTSNSFTAFRCSIKDNSDYGLYFHTGDSLGAIDCEFENNGVSHIHNQGLNGDNNHGMHIMGCHIGDTATNGITINFVNYSLIEGCVFGSTDVTNQVNIVSGHPYEIYIRNCVPPTNDLSISDTGNRGYAFDEGFPTTNMTGANIGFCWYDVSTHILYVYEGSGVWKSSTFT